MFEYKKDSGFFDKTKNNYEKVLQNNNSGHITTLCDQFLRFQLHKTIPMWQFQIKFLDKYIRLKILKKEARIPAIYIGTFWESIPRNFLDKTPNVMEKNEKKLKKKN